LTDDVTVRVVDHPRGERPDSALDLRDVQVDAAPRAPPVQKTGSQRDGDVARSERVGDRAERTDRLEVGPAGEEREARERRALRAEARIVLIRPGLAVQTRGDHYEVGLEPDERLVVEAERSHRAWREVLQDGVGPLEHQTLHDGYGVWVLQVER